MWITHMIFYLISYYPLVADDSQHFENYWCYTFLSHVLFYFYQYNKSNCNSLEDEKPYAHIGYISVCDFLLRMTDTLRKGETEGRGANKKNCHPNDIMIMADRHVNRQWIYICIYLCIWQKIVIISKWYIIIVWLTENRRKKK